MNIDKYENYTISSNDSEKRLDNIIRRFLPKLPLQRIFKAIRSGDIRVDSFKVKQNHRLIEGDILNIYKPLLQNQRDKKNDSSQILDTKRIIFENSDILIYNKPSGLIIHGENKNLSDQVNFYLRDKVIKNLSFNPGPLHRLDRNTQGLVTFSVSLRGARIFTNMLQNSEIDKCYLTIVDGSFNKREIWTDKIARDEKKLISFKSESGKVAKSTFIPIFTKKNKTIALVKIETGRTHQIRVHCSIHNRPITGDKKYGSNTEYMQYFLAAISLTFLKNNDIIEDRNITLPIELSMSKVLDDMITADELDKVKKIILRELK